MTDIEGLIARLRAPAYWMSGSSEGHEGENTAPLEAADKLTMLKDALEAIAKPGVGAAFDWSAEECAGYWANIVTRNRGIARAALTATKIEKDA